MAINLLNQVGGRRVAGRLVVDRISLIQWVSKVRDEESWIIERQKETSTEISQKLAELQSIRQELSAEGKTPKQFLLFGEVFATTFGTLPPNIGIEKGKITIEFPPENPEAALSSLYELSMAMSNDFHGFEKLACEIKRRKPRTMEESLLELELDRLEAIKGI